VKCNPVILINCRITIQEFYEITGLELEEHNGQIATFEFKWNPNAKYKYPNQFMEAYPNSTFEIIHRDNFEEFLF
jgi:hypothetical protein